MRSFAYIGFFLLWSDCPSTGYQISSSRKYTVRNQNARSFTRMTLDSAPNSNLGPLDAALNEPPAKVTSGEDPTSTKLYDAEVVASTNADDPSVFAFGSVIALAMVPFAAFLVWKNLQTDDESDTIEVTKAETVIEEKTRSPREEIIFQKSKREAIIAKTKADFAERVEAARVSVLQENDVKEKAVAAAAAVAEQARVAAVALAKKEEEAKAAVAEQARVAAVAEQARVAAVALAKKEEEAKAAAAAAAVAEQARVAAVALAKKEEVAKAAAAAAALAEQARVEAIAAGIAKREADALESARKAAVTKKDAEDKEIARVAAVAKKDAEDKEIARVAAVAKKDAEDKEIARVAAVAKKDAADKEIARVAAVAKKDAEDKEIARVAAVAKKEVADALVASIVSSAAAAQLDSVKVLSGSARQRAEEFSNSKWEAEIRAAQSLDGDVNEDGGSGSVLVSTPVSVRQMLVNKMKKPTAGSASSTSTIAEVEVEDGDALTADDVAVSLTDLPPRTVVLQKNIPSEDSDIFDTMLTASLETELAGKAGKVKINMLHCLLLI